MVKGSVRPKCPLSVEKHIHERTIGPSATILSVCSMAALAPFLALHRSNPTHAKADVPTIVNVDFPIVYPIPGSVGVGGCHEEGWMVKILSRFTNQYLKIVFSSGFPSEGKPPDGLVLS